MDNENELNSQNQNTPIQNTPTRNIPEQNIPMQNIPNFENNNQQNAYLLNSIIDSLSGWMKFIGIYTIISGALTCLGIITAAIGVPLILAGIALTKGSKSIKNYKQYNSPYILNEVFSSMNKYFKIQGILTIISIVILVIYFVILLFALVFSFRGFFYNYF